MSRAPDDLIQLVNQGREAALALRVVREIIEEMTTQIMEAAVSAQRASELDGQSALVAWGKISAIWALQDTLENRIQLGEAAALEKTGQNRKN